MSRDGSSRAGSSRAFFLIAPLLLVLASVSTARAQANAGCPGEPFSGQCQVTVHLQGGITGQSIRAGLFTPNAQVTLEVFDSSGTREFGPDSRTTDRDGNASFPYNRLDPGDEVVVTDAATGTVKRVVVVPLTIDAVDTSANTVSGTGPPDTTITVSTSVPMSKDTLSDATGAWMVDFGVDGTDLAPGMTVSANVGDDDGDIVVTEPRPGCPPVAQTCTFRVDLVNDQVFANAFTPNSQVRFEVFDSGGTLLFGPVVRTTSASGAEIFGSGHAVDLAAGQRVVLTDLATSIAKSLHLSNLAITSIDTANDIVSGTADPGDLVHVAANVNQSPQDPGDYFVDVTADENGLWTVDFGAGGADLPDQLPEQNSIQPSVTDDDGDVVTTSLPNGCPRIGNAWGCLITSVIEHDSFGVIGFTPFSDARVEVFDPSGASVYGPVTLTTDRSGNAFASIPLGLGPDLVPGSRIHATDVATGTVKELVVGDVTVDLVDVEADVVGGRAPPGTRVQVAELFPVADSNGNWVADFRAVGIDILDEDFFFATISDAEGDATADQLGAPIPGCVDDADTACGSAGPDGMREDDPEIIAGIRDDTVITTVDQGTDDVEISPGKGDDGVVISPDRRNIRAVANVTVGGSGGADTTIVPEHAGGLTITVSGGDGDDIVKTRDVGGRGSNGSYTLEGGGGNDRLESGDGRDRLDGGRGRDVLDGGRGFDVCIGTRGVDTFRSCERIVERRNI